MSYSQSEADLLRENAELRKALEEIKENGGLWSSKHAAKALAGTLPSSLEAIRAEVKETCVSMAEKLAAQSPHSVVVALFGLCVAIRARGDGGEVAADGATDQR